MKVGDKMLCIKTKILDSGAYTYAKIVKDRYYVVSGISSSLIYIRNGNYTISEDDYVLCIKPIKEFELNELYKINNIIFNVISQNESNISTTVIYVISNYIKHYGFNMGQLEGFVLEDFSEYFMPKKELRKQKLQKINESR